MSQPVAIVDYGMGNLRSVQNAVAHVGGKSAVVTNPLDLSTYGRIIRPGVGAFGQAIACLRQTGLADALDERRAAGASILGICLGMQLMCSVSEENGIHEGLDWFAARVIPFMPDAGLSVPHMGWNGVDFTRARYSIFYSVGFSLGKYDQAEKRTHRPGQVKPVTHIHLVARGTVDVKIMRALEKRADIVKAILAEIKN